MWSGYLNWLRQLLPKLQGFDDSYATVSAANRANSLYDGLVPFLTLLLIVGIELEAVMPGVLGVGNPTPSRVLHKWTDALQLDRIEDLELRDPITTAVTTCYDVYWGSGIIGDQVYSRKGLFGYSEGKQMMSGLQMSHRDIRVVPFRPQPGTQYLRGTTSDWLATLRSITDRTFPVESARSLGRSFARISRTPNYMPGYTFKKTERDRMSVWTISRDEP